MDRNEAKKALDSVNQTHGKLANQATWPFWRHALFGIAEASFIFGLSLPIWGTAICLALAGAIILWVINDDKQRYGMFVSGWNGKRPRILLIVLLTFVVAMAIVSFSARGETVPAPAALGAMFATFAACTIGSISWEKLYRAELRMDSGA